MKRLLLLFFTLTSFQLLQAQNGTLAGKVLDAATGEVLPSLSVSLPNGSGKTTDVEGKYSFSLPAGTYSLTFEFVGYKSKTVSDIVVKAGEVTELNVTMESSAKELKGVTVTASARKESIASVLTIQKNNSSISDGISIESIKKSPDRNVGEVLKRVSGTSIQDDKFVVVRGLSDRYNVATINGALLPSTEPDRRAFSFDIVPSNLIDNIVINKTATPDLPGDFAGGLVQILTKDIPFKSFFNISASVGYNTISTGEDFNIGVLKPTDYLGFDNGTRAFPDRFPSRNRYLSYNSDPNPDRRIQASRYMRNNYGDRYDGNALPTMSGAISWGTKKDLKNGGTMGTILSLTYRTDQKIQFNERRDYQTENSISLDPGNLFFDYRDTTYTFNTSLGVLANFAYKKGNSKYVFKNIFNRVFDNSNLIREGYNYDNRQYIRSNGSVLVEKSLISSQLEGEHKVSNRNDRLKWNLNYALTLRNQPDYRVLPYSKNIDQVDDKNVKYRVVLRDTYRFWSDLMDNAFGANLNYSLPFNFNKERSTFKAGLFGQYKIRDFKTRIFRYEQAGQTLNQLLPVLPPEQIFNDGNIYREGFVLNEITNNTDKYDANSGLYAGYAMVDGRLLNNLRAVVGVRVESFNFVVNTFNLSGAEVEVNRNYLDVLPSLNLTYSLTAKQNVRFSASRTVSRPEFREVANFAYYDFVRNAQLSGNPNLERSQITNLDLRYEWYPSAGEIISVSGFYKHFNKPIEQIVLNGSVPSNLQLSFANPNSAQNYGVEVELRKNLSFLNSGALWLEGLQMYVNAALIKSTVDFNENNNPYDPDRPLQGQSPYIFNAGLLYSTPENTLSFSARFNRIGHRIAYVGFQGYPDIYENGRSILDFQVAVKAFSKKGEFKLNFSDVLNQRAIFYQNVDLGDKTSYDGSKDRVQYNFLYGTNISVGFSYGF